VSLPLPSMLSGSLVAFTIELDDELEHRMPHRTAAGRARGEAPRGPWLTSLVMCANVLRHVDADGTLLAEVHERAATTRDSMAGLQRWGYVTRSADDVVRPTAAGRRAQATWRPLDGEIEERWPARFGAATVDRLRTALAAVLAGVDLHLPRYLPIIAPTRGGRSDVPGPRRAGDASPDELSARLAQVLLAFTVEHEAASRVSRPVGTDVVRVLGTDEARVAELPRRTGVSKEAHTMALGFLARIGCVELGTAPSGGGKAVRLTDKGTNVAAEHRRVLHTTEQAWTARHPVAGLRAALDPIVGDDLTADRCPLFGGFGHHPDGWRARLPRPATLPHHPMVLHRGGYPDGS
jgi:hypothetical protein